VKALYTGSLDITYMMRWQGSVGFACLAEVDRGGRARLRVSTSQHVVVAEKLLQYRADIDTNLESGQYEMAAWPILRYALWVSADLMVTLLVRIGANLSSPGKHVPGENTIPQNVNNASVNSCLRSL
jgi:hypothetical protein